MSDHDAPQQREYVGFVWVGDEPGVRVRLVAASLDDARAQLIAEYGTGHVISIWNEDDADRPRK
ncbi:hypothetical protein [Nocardioides antri]|uniref:Uncharacterized protein n=1 Tax=Nocardioides antri TaxID=2607659 RepID=A0A5B1LT23_9ACTN|nr:hypothetical protein [Nocardioides antri]KAA1424025.1 hypothetical protein F0U47_20065 [Nocardioides antri]